MNLIETLIRISPVLVNTVHILFYINLRARNPVNILLLLVLNPLPMVVSLAVSPDNHGISAIPATFFVLHLFYMLWMFRQLATDDGYPRLFFCGALVVATGMVAILPIKVFLLYVLRIPPGDRLTILCLIVYLFVLVPALPFLYRYTCRPIRKLLDAVETQRWYIVVPIPVSFCLLGLAASAVMDSDPGHPAVRLMGLVIPAAIVVYFVSTSAFLINRNARIMLQQRLAAAEQLEKTYQFYNIELSRKEQSLRKLRHDFRHHLIHLESLARDGDLDGIESHLKSLSGFDREFSVTTLCENPAVNAIVSFHLSVAEKNGAACIARAFVPEKIPIGGAELSLIIGNALENSVKATAPLGELGYIAFTAYLAKSYLVIKISNNHEKKAYRRGQGVGLESIREIAEKYQGRVDVADDGREFDLTVYLRMTV